MGSEIQKGVLAKRSLKIIFLIFLRYSTEYTGSRKKRKMHSFNYIAVLMPGSSEMLLVMLVLLFLFGAKDAPRIMRKINNFINYIRRTANSFKYDMMYSDHQYHSQTRTQSEDEVVEGEFSDLDEDDFSESDTEDESEAGELDPGQSDGEEKTPPAESSSLAEGDPDREELGEDDLDPDEELNA